MRNALGLMLASVVTALVITAVWFWTSSPRADAAPPQTVAARKAEPLPAPAAAKLAPKDDVEITASLSKPAPAPAPVPAAQPARSACANPDALGVSRTVVIDTTGGPGFGFLQYKQFDFLTDKEIVLTFDDGPWPTTPAVLKALADECTKGCSSRSASTRPITRKFSARFSMPATPSARIPGRTRISTARR